MIPSGTFAPLADTVTVAVPTRDERANVGPFLASLPRDLSLIVVDRSEDGTPDLVRSLRPDHTLVLRSEAGVAAARQCAAEVARTPWILFTDADVSFAPDYFARLAARALTPELGGLFGTKITADAHPTYHRLFRLGQGLCAACRVPAGSGSNMLVSRNAWARAGGFDLSLSCNEDSEFLWRIQSSGYQVEFAPELEVVSRDHRRLARGTARKMIHSIARCGLLYTGLLPEALRRADWGYWSGR